MEIKEIVKNKLILTVKKDGLLLSSQDKLDWKELELKINEIGKTSLWNLEYVKIKKEKILSKDFISIRVSENKKKQTKKGPSVELSSTEEDFLNSLELGSLTHTPDNKPLVEMINDYYYSNFVGDLTENLLDSFDISVDYHEEITPLTRQEKDPIKVQILVEDNNVEVYSENFLSLDLEKHVSSEIVEKDLKEVFHKASALLQNIEDPFPVVNMQIGSYNYTSEVEFQAPSVSGWFTLNSRFGKEETFVVTKLIVKLLRSKGYDIKASRKVVKFEELSF